MGRFFDLSHKLEDGMITYPGLPGPIICDFWSREYSRKFYAEGTEFQIGKIEMVSNTGTYIDSPFHRYADGDDLAGLSLENIAMLEGIVIRKPRDKKRAVPIDILSDINVEKKAVLFDTGWDQKWGTELYFKDHFFLTEEIAVFLRDSGASLVGIDSLNIDDTEDGKRPVHSILLAANIPIVEHMCNLNLLPDNGFSFQAVPPKIRGLGSFPIRAFAYIP